MLLCRRLLVCLMLVSGCHGTVTHSEVPGDTPVPGGDGAAPACDDGLRNGDETDVDCGGSCTSCQVGAACTSEADCTTGLCIGGTCLPETCDDELPNGDETDVDCGGSCAPCSSDRSCATDADCLSAVCVAGACAAAACDDGIANGTETDLDCGGVCSACADGRSCGIDADCVSRVCDGQVCAAPACTDGTENGDESDVDCGGDCSPCADGAACNGPSDCESGLCVTRVCVDATCTNNSLDPGETDIDCGGACAPCANGDTCAVDGDCQSGVCADTCQAPACEDGVTNGDESDVDCGGSCAPCPNGATCLAGGDCQSGVCAGGVCRVPSCDDGVENGDETDVDCGGSCPACDTAEGCTTAADCTSGVCSSGLCQIPSCSDGVHNGQETDLDCGGTCPSPCADGSACLADADCISDVCVVFSCAAPVCDDGVENGDETDVDCGGLCTACADGAGCAADEDCESGHCTAGVCVDAGCDNGTQDGDETDVDCGGSCAACADGATCVADGDCHSSVCNGTCQAPACDDGVTNGDESYIDCGGSCAPCPDGADCTAAPDCQSGVCAAGTCATPSCTDGVFNGDETDVDCGGPTCPGCLVGGDCVDDDDCAGGACVTGNCTEQLTILSLEPTAIYRGHPDDVVLFVQASGLTDPAGLYVYFTNGVPACQFDWDGTPPLPVAPVTCTSGDPNEIVAVYDDCSLTGTSCRVLADAGGEPFVLMALLHPNPNRPLGSYSVSVAAINGTFDTAGDVLEMVATPPPTVTAVSPASAWTGSPDDAVVSDRAVLVEGTGMLPVPDVVWVNINRPDQRFAAPYVEYLAAGMLSAVVPSESQQMPASLYHVRVVNPDGQSAYWIDGSTRGLFEVTTRAPPLIEDIDPLRIPKTEIATLTALLIHGNNFADDFASGAAARVFVKLPDDTLCEIPVLPASSSETQVAADVAGAVCPFDHYDYPLVVLNPDGQSATHYTFSVTEDSQGHLGTPQSVPHTLVEARGQHDGVAAYDDLGNGYVYVGGGIAPQSTDIDAVFAGSAQPVLSTVEAAQVSFTGEIGQWRTLRQTDPAGFSGLESHELPRQNNVFTTPRAGIQMVRVGRFLYAIGGRDDVGAVLGTTERAELLGAGTAPGIQFARLVGASDPELAGGCGGTELLAAGTYSYRVAVVTATGEGLASRSVAVSVPAPGCVELQWEHVTATAGDATHPPRPAALYYVVYRTSSPDGSPQTERFLTWVPQTAAEPCKQPNGLLTGVTACHRAFDTGQGALAPAPGNLRPADAAGSLTAGHFYAYRASVVAAGLELRSGVTRVYEVPAGGGIAVTWDAIPDADQYCLYRSLAGAEDAAAAATESTFRLGCVPAETVSLTDDGSAAPDPLAAAPEPAGRLPRGSTTMWRVIDDGASAPEPVELRTPRWLHESITMHVDDPMVPDRVHFYIFAVGGLPSSGVGVDAVASTERVEVSALTGDFLPVADYATPTRFWDYERQDLSSPGDCDGDGANCLSMAWGRSLFALLTTQDRFATGDPSGPIDPCAIPDRDGDGFNSILCGGSDCDDLDSLRNPAAEPICVDASLLTTCAPCCPPPPLDADADGFDTTEAGCCDPDVRLCDCDDADSQRYPGAVEICGDGVDQDCDGLDAQCACTIGPWPPTSSDCTCCTDDPVIRAQYDPDGDGAFDAASPCCVPTAGCACETACTPWPPTPSDDTCCWVPETLAEHDRDGDGYFDSVSPCCIVTAMCDCDDFASGINPGAVDICENGIDEDCDGSDPPCDECDLDGDGYLSTRPECGGNDCCDAGNEPSLGCDGTVAIDDPHHPANINPGISDAHLPPDCQDGIDNDCDGIDMPCLVGLTAQQADPDPIYLVAMSGSRGVDASGTEIDNTDPVIEIVGIETTPARLGHMAWDDPCAPENQGMTCMVGWEPDRVAPTGSGAGAAAINYGLEAVLYYDYIFRFGGTFSDTMFVDGSGGTYRNAVCLYSGCLSVPQPDGCHLTCPVDLADYDVNEHLIERSTQSVGDAVLTPRTMFALVRLFSRIFSIGGLGPTGLPLDDVESIHQ